MAQPAPAWPEPAARRSRRRRYGLWQPIVGLLLIVFVVLAVADRVAAAVAEGELKSRVAAELAAHNVGYSSLDVTVGGLPFLTQVVRERYDSLAIDMADVNVQADGREATLPELHIVATGVEVDTVELAQGHAAATAEQVTGTAVISYATLSSLTDLGAYHLVGLVFEERDGALSARANVTALGVELPIEAAAEITVRDGTRIEVRLRDAAAVGVSVPDAALPLLDMLANAVLVATVPPLPFGITIDGFEVAPDGLAVTAVGRAVTLARPG